jgi:uncharacterized membrane protein YqjE
LFGPYVFCLTEEEARAGASRLALRRGLAGAFERFHVVPLAVFVLLLVFISILAFAGLIGRRPAEAALIVSAILFMAARFYAHWRLRAAQKASLVAARMLLATGEMHLAVDCDGATLTGSGEACRCNFSSRATVEDAGGLIYFWPEKGEPFFAPTRVFASAEEAAAFVAQAKERTLAMARGR